MRRKSIEFPRHLPRTFVAIDFETADYERDSACAVAIVKVVDLQIVGTHYRLIRPPRKQFVFSYLHHIYWKDVQNEPTFSEVWPQLMEHLDGAMFMAAHNAGFDQKVLQTCCLKGGLSVPEIQFQCSMRLARAKWKLYPTKLPDVCRFLKIPLDHHHAGSDAEACAKIIIAAAQESSSS
jgi:DNA polymerase III subunit epsilon